MGPSPNRVFGSPSGRKKLVIDVVDSLSPGDTGDPGLSARLLDTFTPKSRKVAKIAVAEVRRVLSFHWASKLHHIELYSQSGVMGFKIGY
jgi:hypothetical protein